MDKERQGKIIIYTGVLAAAVLAFLAAWFFGSFVLNYVFLLILLFIIVINLKFYLRIQHNIDRSKTEFQARLAEIIKSQAASEHTHLDRLQEGANKPFAYKEWFDEKIMPGLIMGLFKNELEGSKDDVSIIIGWRNKGVGRAYNALKSIREQDYDQQKINIIFIDYGSDDEQAILKIKNACDEFNAVYIRVEGVDSFNRAHCMNIGIRKSSSKYILFSDIDTIFEKNYISKCVIEMKNNLFQALYVNLLKRPKNSGLESRIDNYYELKDGCSLEFNTNINEELNPELIPAAYIFFTMRKYIYLINGYDEFYKFWGFDSADILKRLKAIGVKITNISQKTSHIHQWHPSYKTARENSEFAIKLQESEHYFWNQNSVLRNKDGWGEVGEHE